MGLWYERLHSNRQRHFYKTAYFNNDIGSLTAPYADTGSGTLLEVTETPVVFMGPANNPTWDCTQDPFWLDIDGDGKIKTDSTGKICLEPTFSSNWSAAQFVNDTAYLQCIAMTNASGWCPDESSSASCGGGNAGNVSGPVNTDIVVHTGGSAPSYSNCTGAQGTVYSNTSNTYLNSNFPSTPLTQTQAKGLLLSNPSNSYKFGDAKSISVLLHLAFGPMLDGKHTLDNSTPLNALQEFGLVYMFFTGNNGGNGGFTVPGIYTQGGSTNSFEMESGACSGNSAAGVPSCNSSIGLSMHYFHQYKLGSVETLLKGQSEGGPQAVRLFFFARRARPVI